MYRWILKMAVPLPDVRKMKTAVFVGPHPDDIEIGAGGTVHRMVLQGTAVTFVLCTDGRSGTKDPVSEGEQIAKIRRSESLAGAARLGVKDVRFLDFPDGGDYSERDLSRKLAEVLADIRPEIVFCPDPMLRSEIHPDHLRTGNAVRTAVFWNGFASILRQNGIPFDPQKVSQTPSPALAYFYTDHCNRKIALSGANVKAKTEAILCHKSQFSGLGAPEVQGMFRYLKLRQTAMGWSVLRLQAEGFFMMAPLHQHAFPEVLNF